MLRSWEPHTPDLPPTLDDGDCAGWTDGDRVEGRLLRGLTADTDTLPDGIQLDGVRLERVRAVGGQLRRWRLVDVVLDDCDLAGVIAERGEIGRVEIHGGRANGTAWIDGELRDLVVDGLRAKHLVLRASTLRRVRFVDCELPNLDLTGARLDHVAFQRCLLTGAEFHDAQVLAATFTECDLSGALGVDRLRGATVDALGLTSLAGSMAQFLGIGVSP